MTAKTYVYEASAFPKGGVGQTFPWRGLHFKVLFIEKGPLPKRWILCVREVPKPTTKKGGKRS